MDANRTSTSFADPWLENFSRVLEEHRTRFAAGWPRSNNVGNAPTPQLVAEIDAWEQDRDRGHPAEHDDEAEDFRRRYELALDDIHQLRSRNASLQNQVAQLERQQTQEPASGGLDWEAEKRRIFAALDRGFGQDEAAELERLRVEEVVALPIKRLPKRTSRSPSCRRVCKHSRRRRPRPFPLPKRCWTTTPSSARSGKTCCGYRKSVAKNSALRKSPWRGSGPRSRVNGRNSTRRIASPRMPAYRPAPSWANPAAAAGWPTWASKSMTTLVASG